MIIKRVGMETQMILDLMVGYGALFVGVGLFFAAIFSVNPFTLLASIASMMIGFAVLLINT